MSTTQYLYQSRLELPRHSHRGNCAMCGGQLYGDQPVNKVIKSTFTNLDMLTDDKYICGPCVWFLDNANEDIQQWLDLDKPRAARMYSHILKDGQWYLLNKADRIQMAELFHPAIPEVAVIADSGQKHLVFRSRINPPNENVGWVTFEEQTFQMDVYDFWHVYELADTLYQNGFTKASIQSGMYTFYPDSDIELQRTIEPQFKQWRGSLTFDLAVWMIVRQEETSDD